VRAGHEGRHLFVPDLHEFEPVARSLQSAEEPVNAVTGVAKDPPHTPFT